MISRCANIIKSCKTIDQLESARRYVYLASKYKYPDNTIQSFKERWYFRDILEDMIDSRINLIKEGELQCLVS